MLIDYSFVANKFRIEYSSVLSATLISWIVQNATQIYTVKMVLLE
jgi:hypothetical protein